MLMIENTVKNDDNYMIYFRLHVDFSQGICYIKLNNGL